MPRISPLEKRDLLVKKRAQLDAQLKALEARTRETERKRDTRRKIIAGALALEHMDKNPNDSFGKKMRELLNDYVEPRSRDLFPFLAPLTGPMRVTPVEPDKGAAGDVIDASDRAGGSDVADVAA